ncbi:MULTISPECIES: helix-turn-helix domain-containing protein [Arthrobacter]|uniref:helix-turn-helix domain-containing protein n=1 Tax=unclassified Arthrobacter TaxID=235627 RepID=UPI0024B9B9E3|nr:helix-turn-helix domain-containing protein [Arthrobacter sp. H35-MC1]MDJ0318515.1 helix-turn-helix domain-containing protein [Arthrobacter sp. H35-MC1]
MTLHAPKVSPALEPSEQAALARTLTGEGDVTVFVDGTAHRLGGNSRDAVVDLLSRLSRGDTVSVASIADLLTTSQAAELAGISHTFLRNLTDRGEVGVQYRGSHRRIHRQDIMAWLSTQKGVPPKDPSQDPSQTANE